MESFPKEESKQNIINNYTILNKGVINMVRSTELKKNKRIEMDNEQEGEPAPNDQEPESPEPE